MKVSNRNWEVIFQVLVHLVVFVFYSFDRNEPSIALYKYVYFINYAIAAAIINYVCLPLFYRKKNLLVFIGLIALVILGSALLEEFILEPIFFTGPRAETIKMLWAFIDIIPVVAILSGVKFGWDAMMKQHEVDRLEEAVKDSELQFLKSQINPHFLFNNLNNLYSYALEGSNKTPEIILALSNLLRYMLYECKEEFVSLNKEISQLRNFVNLNNLQIEDRGKVTFSVDGLNESYKIAPLILMVFIENAFKHSQSSQSDDIEIDIKLQISDGGRLHFTCSNTFQETTNIENLDQGIGLKNARKRLDLTYKNAHTLQIDQSNQRYVVDLFIDLHKHQ